MAAGYCHIKIGDNTPIRWKRLPTPAIGMLQVATVHFPGGYNKGFMPA